MILEVADIRILPDREAEFEAALQLALGTIFPRAKGFLGHEVQHSIESPNRYLLLLRWENLEDHTIHFRGSELFTEWRRLVSEFFEQPPFVEHCKRIAW